MRDIYAYSVPESEREGLVPNLRILANQPWMGLTAYLGDRPHLVIGKKDQAFILEDESGNQKLIDFTFNWEQPPYESNRLVAASRDSKSPFKTAGLLVFDHDSGAWDVRTGISNMAFPLEAKVAELEKNGWRVTSDEVNPQEVTVEVHGRCPNCGSDSLEYANTEDPDPLSGVLDDDGDDRVVLCHACHEWCKESELRTDDDASDDDQKGTDRKHLDDSDDKESKVAASTAFSFQGILASPARIPTGVAICADKESLEQQQSVMDKLDPPNEEMRKHVDLRNQENQTSFPYSDNPYINRGGSVQKEAIEGIPVDPISPTQPSYPEQFFGQGFVVVQKWFTPDDATNYLGHKRWTGIITSEGGVMSHAVVVARGESLGCVIANRADVDRIQPGDHIEFDNQSGVIHVNGGDPNFVPVDPNDLDIDQPLYRFAYAGGHGLVERMVEGSMVGELGGHQGMMGSLMTSGHAQMEMDPNNPTDIKHNLALGFICDDGKVLQGDNHIPDQNQFIQWIHGEEQKLGLPPGQIQRIDMAKYLPGQGVVASVKIAGSIEMPYPGGMGIHNGTSAAFADAGLTATVTAPGLPAPITLPFSAANMFVMIKMFQMQGMLKEGAPITITSDNPDLAAQIIHQQSGVTAAITDKPEQSLKCQNCDSHTISALEDTKDKEKGTATFICHNCGETSKLKYRIAGAEHPKGTRIEMVHPSKKGIKGSITNHVGTDDNFGDHLYDVILDNGDEMKKVPEIHFTKIKSSSVELWKEADLDEEEPPAWFIEELDRQLVAKLASSECNNCGHSEYDHTGQYDECTVPGCTCDRFDSDEYRRASMQKGAPYPENSYKNAPDHAPNKQDWPKEVNAVYNACVRESHGESGEASKETKTRCAKIAWAQYKKTVKEKGRGNTKPEKDSSVKEAFDPSYLGPHEVMAALHAAGYMVDQTGHILTSAGKAVGHFINGVVDFGKKPVCPSDEVGPLGCPIQTVPTTTTGAVKLPEDVLTGNDTPTLGKDYTGQAVMCYMCGNTRNASLGGRCEHCGYVLTVRRDGPPFKDAANWTKSSALEKGNWYSMYSPDYKVPDVIKVEDVNDHGIKASIEGDDKGVWPLELKHEEIEEKGYFFEPYTPSVGSSDNNVVSATQKEARRNYSVREQQDLVNENLHGKARNFDKVNLEGTHYPQGLDFDVDENPLWLW
jgi:phosphohistidine swiveling domain-containing protein